MPGAHLTSAIRRPLRPLIEFLRTESAGGALLVIATLIALVWANLDPAGYDAFWAQPLHIDALDLRLDLRHWVNDGLMALFFLVVGLEIKRELIDGELRDRRRAVLPVIAALGGMAVPALLFVAVTAGDPGATRGWGIPMATDIAFAIGVLSLLGKRVPTGLKVFLLSLAIVDDIGAILVIAAFYSGEIALTWLALALALLALYIGLWRFSSIRAVAPLLATVGVLAWFAVHASGVHAAIAGVALGLAAPAGEKPDPSPTERLEHSLHPLSSYAVVPLFALANAGVVLTIESLREALMSPIAIGVFVGLVVGKFVGVAGATLLAVRFGVASLGPDIHRQHLVGAAALAGIGFTVSLFIAQLAYADAERIDAAKIGIFAGSLLSAVIGLTVLRGIPRRRKGRRSTMR